jgi:hypothetical protein
MTENAQLPIRALEDLGVQFRAIAGDERTTPGGPIRARSVVVALAVFVVLGVFSLTPPGRAAADWVADRFGIGEQGGAPTLTEFREFANEGTIADGARAYVLATGPAPHNLVYEFITFRSNADGAHCFETDVRKKGGGAFLSTGGPCGQIPQSGGLSLDGAGGSLSNGLELRTALGRASLDIATVEVELNGKRQEAELTLVDEGVAEELGFNGPFQIFASFFTEMGGALTVTGRDAEGEVVATDSAFLSDPYEDHRRLCLRLRASAAAGRTSEEKADAFCQAFAAIRAEKYPQSRNSGR